MGPAIITTVAFLLSIKASVSIPLTSPTSPPSEIGQPCGQSLGDCASPLTCIPLSANCTEWVHSGSEGCPGTCQHIDIAQQHIYTLCGGWGFFDDCDESRELCVADPRNADECGPSCDGPGICWPFDEWCKVETGEGCAEGKGCFGGMCFALRFGSDYYEKTMLEEVYRPN